jgi:ComF family protein
MHPFLVDVKNLVLDTLFPVNCLVCNREGVFLCSLCQVALKRLEQQSCIVCEKASLAGITHPKCSAPFLPEGLVSFLDYRDKNLSHVLIAGKYSFLPGVFGILGEVLASFLSESIWREIFQGFIVIPLPLSKSRRRWRGFNQAEILVNVLSEKLGMLQGSPLVKQNTRTQKDLNKEQRRKNVLGCFSLKAGAEVRGKNYILVDDVVTTGATLMEASKVLKRNGAAKVWCMTIARD